MVNLREAAPLPATRQEFLASRALKQKRTINDLVEDIVVANWEDPDFIRFIEATDDAQAVEGSKKIDDVMAAQYIRNKAGKNGYTEVVAANLLEVKNAVRVVLHRYRNTRNDRLKRQNGGQPNGGSPTTATE